MVIFDIVVEFFSGEIECLFFAVNILIETYGVVVEISQFDGVYPIWIKFTFY